MYKVEGTFGMTIADTNYNRKHENNESNHSANYDSNIDRSSYKQ